MKKLFYIVASGLLVTLVSCEESPKVKEQPYNESRELVPNPEGYKKDTSFIKQADSALHKEKLKPDS